MEKCGTGPELLNDHRRERMRSYGEMLQRPNAGGDVVWDWRIPAGGYADLLRGNVWDKKEFSRAKIDNCGSIFF